MRHGSEDSGRSRLLLVLMSLLGTVRSSLTRRFRQARHRALVGVADEANFWSFASPTPVGRGGAALWGGALWVTARLVPRRVSLAWYRMRALEHRHFSFSLMPASPGFLERVADQAPDVALTDLMSARAPVGPIAAALVRATAEPSGPTAVTRRAVTMLLGTVEGQQALLRSMTDAPLVHPVWRLLTPDDLALLLNSSSQECRLWALINVAQLSSVVPVGAPRDLALTEVPLIVVTPGDPRPSAPPTVVTKTRPRTGRSRG